MAVTILHISDLHRDSESQITTVALLNSLARDRDRYVAEGKISTPDIAVVSGDIIYGASADATDADDQIAAQYAEAHDFLVKLSDTFFSGDRERIVLVPGNHDISMPHVKRASTQVSIPLEYEKKALLASKLTNPDSKYRWDWRSFTISEITDLDCYNQRLAPYAKFYENFYFGGRRFSLDPGAQFSIHDFPEFDLVFAGLSSCHDNDMFNRTGRIHPNAVAKAMAETTALVRKGRIPIGVWHHSIQGGPKETDYVDADIVQSLMDGHCALGMHGHQHRPQLLEHRFTSDQKRSISILSAGTLCGGPGSLPSGRMRGYNILSVDVANRRGTLFVRQMTNSDFSSPVWGPSYIAEFSGSSVSFAISQPAFEISTMELADRGEQLLKSGHAAAAYTAVKSDMSNPYLRRIAATALGDMKDWRTITNIFNPPQSPAEFIFLSEALEELKAWPALKQLHESAWAVKSTDTGVKQCIEITRPMLEGKTNV